MAVTWTTIPAGDVDVDSPLTVALITSLRDNPEGIAQRATGAPKIWGNAYDYQEFLSTGDSPWTKPSNAESGDHVIVQVVGGGGSGERDSGGDSGGGAGGAGGIQFFDDIDDLGATEILTIGAGGAVKTTNGDGNVGGDSSFGTADTTEHIFAEGGEGGETSTPGGSGGVPGHFLNEAGEGSLLKGGNGSGTFTKAAGNPSIYGGGGGGARGSDVKGGGLSARAGFGGRSALSSTNASPGAFPGGGGGASASGDSGAGANGVVRVWCIKED